MQFLQMVTGENSGNTCITFQTCQYCELSSYSTVFPKTFSIKIRSKCSRMMGLLPTKFLNGPGCNKVACFVRSPLPPSPFSFAGTASNFIRSTAPAKLHYSHGLARSTKHLWPFFITLQTTAHKQRLQLSMNLVDDIHSLIQNLFFVSRFQLIRESLSL